MLDQGDAADDPSTGPSPPGASDDPTASDQDDLAGVTTSMSRLLRRSRGPLALLVAAALVVPSAGWLLDELGFRSSGDAVTQALGADASLADSLLLVRATSCTGVVVTGTAFVVDLGDGPTVVTNRHVVEGAARVGLRSLRGGDAINVARHRVSAHADVAVLELIDPDDLPPALSAGADARVGDPVRLVGFPSGQPFTTEGEVVASDLGRLLVGLRTDPGASGSPVVDSRGAVVGQIYARTGDGDGVATPIGALIRAVAGARPDAGC